MGWALPYKLSIFPDLTVMTEIFITALLSVEVIISLLKFLNPTLLTRKNRYCTEQGVRGLKQCFGMTR
jgi:hypothetical protein